MQQHASFRSLNLKVIDIIIELEILLYKYFTMYSDILLESLTVQIKVIMFFCPKIIDYLLLIFN